MKTEFEWKQRKSRFEQWRHYGIRFHSVYAKKPKVRVETKAEPKNVSTITYGDCQADLDLIGKIRILEDIKAAEIEKQFRDYDLGLSQTLKDKPRFAQRMQYIEIRIDMLERERAALWNHS